MKITKRMIRELNPCYDGWRWYLENREEDLLKLLLNANRNNPKDAIWLFTKLMTEEQCLEISIFSARKVLYLFENIYPDDMRPRRAIESAELYLKDPTKEKINASAAINADNAAVNATADAATYAAYAAADAASAAADAAYAVSAAINAANAVNAAEIKVQEEIIIEAVRILDETN